MTTIRENIEEYRHSCIGVQQRIDELSRQINHLDAQPVREGIKALENRRYQLYCELAEMHSHIRGLEDYLDRTVDKPQAVG